jgi:hypothetical protein
MFVARSESKRQLSIYAALATLVASTIAIFPLSYQPASASFNAHNANCDLTNGAGTQGDPYRISTVAELWELADCGGIINAGAHFILSNDISVAGDSTAPTRSPIGRTTVNCDTTPGTKGSPFMGVLNGNNKTISGLDVVGGCYVGLFYQLYDATVFDLNLQGSVTNDDVTLPQNLDVENSTGGLSGSTVGSVTISNLALEMTVSAPALVGGFIGQAVNDSTLYIEGSVFSGHLEATGISGPRQSVGGFVGLSKALLVIKDSTSSAGISVSPLVQYVGGFLGMHQADPIELSNLYRSGSLSQAKNDAGGILGAISATSFATLSGLVNAGSVSASSSGTVAIGGIGGRFDGTGILSDSVNEGEVIGTSTTDPAGTGGMFGRVNGNGTSLQIISATNSGDILGTVATGGLVGVSFGNLSIYASENTGTVTGSSYVGGLVGRLAQANTTFSVSESENSGVIQTTQFAAGGALGGVGVLLTSASISGFTNSGEISGQTQNVGGIVGLLATSMTINSSSNLATISAVSRWAGGAVGQILASANNVNSITGFSNFGRIQSQTTMGGILGAATGDGANSQLRISRTVNYGVVESTGTGGSNALTGGLVGWLKANTGDSLAVELFQSANLSTVSAVMQNAGGIFGVLDTSVSASILESYNQGQVESGNGVVGGLVGLVYGALAVSNSYNVGNLSGTTLIGGLVGNGSAHTSVHNSYFAGTLESTGTRDGLVAGSFEEVSSSYTITTSAHASASTQLELQSRSTFAGWDFDNIWVFGSCEINDSFPVLRWAEQRNFDLSCLQIQTPTTSSPAPTASVPVDTPSAPTYNGPIVNSTPIITSPGETFVLSGSRLSGITQVIVNGVSLDIVSSSEFELVLKLNLDALTGIFDLVIVSPHGRLTVMDAILIRNREAKLESYGELLGFRWAATFVGNSRSLSPSQNEGILGHLNAFDSATTIVCWGYTTSENPNDWAIAHANARAQAVCEQLAVSGSSARLLVRVRYGMPKFAAMRATMQFWELKSSQ